MFPNGSQLKCCTFLKFPNISTDNIKPVPLKKECLVNILSLKEQCREDFAVLGQFCATCKIITLRL